MFCVIGQPVLRELEQEVKLTIIEDAIAMTNNNFFMVLFRFKLFYNLFANVNYPI